MTGVQTCALPICFPVTIDIGGKNSDGLEKWLPVILAATAALLFSSGLNNEMVDVDDHSATTNNPAVTRLDFFSGFNLGMFAPLTWFGYAICIGMLIVVLRRDTIMVLMGIELLLNAANLSLVSFSNSMGMIDGQLQVFFIITVAAAESAIGLSIVVNLYRNFGSIKTQSATTLKG